MTTSESILDEHQNSLAIAIAILNPKLEFKLPNIATIFDTKFHFQSALCSAKNLLALSLLLTTLNLPASLMVQYFY